mgnify:CR=1 FL=1|jgi:hypothetical protein
MAALLDTATLIEVTVAATVLLPGLLMAGDAIDGTQMRLSGVADGRKVMLSGVSLTWMIWLFLLR